MIREEVSIKVHCIVSCLCEVIREERALLDYRPMYFGLWDAAFDVTEQGEITYYQHDLDHSHYFRSYRALFGVTVVEWYDKNKHKNENLDTLLTLLDEETPGRYVMAQIDMSYMPERENKFHQKPFPHFLILTKTEDDHKWMMLDPDFRWRGIVDKEQVVHAFLENPFGGGFYVDANELVESSVMAVDRYFQQGFTEHNELTNLLKTLIPQMVDGKYGYSLDDLTLAVRQLPVLAIRKYSYEHAMMYFIEEAGLSDETFDAYTDLVERIVQGFHSVQYMAIKMSMTGKTDLLDAVMNKLEEMDGIETAVKNELNRLYQLWAIHQQLPDTLSLAANAKGRTL
ncbi:hypothetical protein D3C74_209340 [compost metagenome]